MWSMPISLTLFLVLDISYYYIQTYLHVAQAYLQDQESNNDQVHIVLFCSLQACVPQSSFYIMIVSVIASESLNW